MISRFSTRTVMASLLALVCVSAGCNGRSPTSPTSGPAPPTTPAASGSPPSITAISPNTGSTGGDTPARITGAGFQSGATVSFGGLPVPTRFDHRDPAGTILYFEIPGHAAATVDVVVTNRDGQSARLTDGYTYAPPQSFDFNGTWSGFGNAGQDMPIGFTIQNSLVSSVSCHGYELTTLTFSPPLPVSDGAFSFSRGDGVAFSGRIVSAAGAVGTINFAECTGTIWGASRR